MVRHCRLPIADFRFVFDRSFNRQSAIENWQSHDRSVKLNRFKLFLSVFAIDALQ